MTLNAKERELGVKGSQKTAQRKLFTPTYSATSIKIAPTIFPFLLGKSLQVSDFGGYFLSNDETL